MTDDDQEDQPRPPRRVHFDTPVARPITTRSHGVDIPTDMSSQGIDTPVDTPIDTSQQGIDTPIDSPIDTSPQGTDTPLDTMSQQGIDTPIDTSIDTMSQQGIDTFDTSIDTSSQQGTDTIDTPDDTLSQQGTDTIDTPDDTLSQQGIDTIDTPVGTLSQGIDTHVDTSICRITTPLEILIDTMNDARISHNELQIGDSLQIGGISRLNQDYEKGEYGWETRQNVTISNLPSTSTPAHDAVHKETSIQLNESRDTGHLRDADHHFDRSTESKVIGEHDRHEDSSTPETHDRHDGTRDRHEDSHDRHEDSHDRHDVSHDRHDNRHDHQENQHHTPSPDSESEEEEFKDAENDPPRKRLRGYEEDTPARYSLRKRESNANAVTTASAAASPPLEHHCNGRPTHRPKTDETAASRLIKKTGGYGTIKRVGHQTTPAAPTTNHVHNRGDGSAEAAPTVTLVLNSALQRELRGLLHSWVAHASDIFNHNANTNPDFTSDAAAIHAHPHHGFEGRITEIDISKTAASEITPQVFGYNPSPPPLAQPPPPTQSGLPTPSPPLKIKN
ncbi:hypothetical protein GE061_014740 [Apolygus lucorum]|uniref:Uncharacterized protein n=1 Tax=Apolygus lucorum TaxID=248454 RepID=A0A8S9XJ48_APOLU|nr:hypothetical protein GE061_014740 [Apolygus lucorum]